jgi:hypothetical protein
MNLTYQSKWGATRVRLPYDGLAFKIKALGEAAKAASHRIRKFQQIYEANGPAFKVVASQRQRRHK